MRLRDYSNGYTTLDGGEIEILFSVSDDYEIEVQCPVCRGYGRVDAEEMDSEETHRIRCPICNGSGRYETSVYIETEDDYHTVELDSRSIGAYEDGYLSYSDNMVYDEICDSSFERLLSIMEEKYKEQRMKELTAEEIAELERVKELERQLKELQEALDTAKNTAQTILNGNDETLLFIGARVEVDGCGGRGTIEEMDGSDVPILVRFENGFTQWYREERVHIV